MGDQLPRKARQKNKYGHTRRLVHILLFIFYVMDAHTCIFALIYMYIYMSEWIHLYTCMLVDGDRKGVLRHNDSRAHTFPPCQNMADRFRRNSLEPSAFQPHGAGSEKLESGAGLYLWRPFGGGSSLLVAVSRHVGGIKRVLRDVSA